MSVSTTTLGALGLGLALAAASADRLAFERPGEGALRVTVDARHDLDLVATTLEVGDGEPTRQPGAVAILVTNSATATDARRSEGRPGLRRTFGPASSIVRIGPRDPDGAVPGPDVPLAALTDGASVAFVPAARHPDGFARHFDSIAAPRERVLPGLAPPTDWSALAPPAEGPSGLGVGDAWTVPAGALGALVAPMGDLGLQETTSDPLIDDNFMRAIRSGAGGDLHLLLRGDVEGGARAEVVAVEDGIVEIALRFELSATADITSILDEGHVAPAGLPDSQIQGGEARLSLAGGGTLRWSPSLARPVASRLSGEQSVVLTARTIDIDAVEMVQTLEFVGTFRVETTVEAAEAPPPPRRG